MSYMLIHTPRPEPGEAEQSETYGTYPSLPAAMAAAGHPDPADWHTAVDLADRLFIDWTLYAGDDDSIDDVPLVWAIRATDVATEYSELLTAPVTGA